MQNALNPLAGVYQTQLEASRRLADAIFTGTQRIDSVMIGATHQLFTDQLNFVKELATARDPGSIGSALQARMMSRNSNQATEYQRELVRIVVEMQSEIGQSMQDYVEQVRSQTVDGIKTPFAGLASGATTGATTESNTASNANPMANMFSVWENAFKDVATLARRNMGAAAATANNMTQAASDAATNVADAATAAATSAATSSTQTTASAPEVLVPEAGGIDDISSSDKKTYPSAGGKKK
jgi:hypothetical protein